MFKQVLDLAGSQELQKRFSGRVIGPGDAEYDSARRVWNGMIDKHPALIAQCANENDVVEAVNFARENKMLAAVRGGGHNVAGFATCDDGIVLDLSPMKRVEVHTVKSTARAQAGLTWGEFDKATQAYNLATTGGLVSETGVAGLTLGGGIGWLMRKHGLTLDNLISVDLVTADGQRVTASAAENADLFWGVRGGGGNFGVVTSFEFQLYPVGPTVFGGAIFHPLDKASELLRFYRDWVPTLPDELTTMAAFVTAPPEPFVPKELQGTKMLAIALCYIGPLEQGTAAIQPLRDFAPPPIDLTGPIPYIALQTLFDESAPKGIQSYWKTEYLDGLEDRAIGILVEHAGRMASPFSAIHIHHVEGAVKRVGPDATAYNHRDARFILNMIGMWMDPAESPRHLAWVRELWQAVQPFAAGAPYLNFMGDEGEARVQAAYGPRNYARLVELKKKYDPTNLFRLNQNIKPQGL